MNVLLMPGMLSVVMYFLLALASSSIVLVVQRKFFLRPNEEQSFAVAGPIAFFVGLLYFWSVISSDV